MAIALPDATFDMVEASTRKCAVIETLRDAVGLANTRVVRARAEEWAQGAGREAYDVVTARALAALAVLVEYAAPLLSHGGALIAWKGARDETEERAGNAAAAEVGLSDAAVRRVAPFEGAHSRHLHVFTKVAVTPARFPRRPGMAAKRPLA